MVTPLFWLPFRDRPVPLQLIETMEDAGGESVIVGRMVEDFLAFRPHETVGLCLADAGPVALLVDAHERVRVGIPAAVLTFLQDFDAGKAVARQSNGIVALVMSVTLGSSLRRRLMSSLVNDGIGVFDSRHPLHFPQCRGCESQSFQRFLIM